MLIYPAIDLYQGKAVRLFKGDYNRMTVYSHTPEQVALDFRRQGAGWIHMVDLEGAKTGSVPNFNTICQIKKASGLLCQVGGGIRSLDVISSYLDGGIDRVILGTAAVTKEGFVQEAVKTFGDKIAVGVDIRDGFVAIKGWTEKTEETALIFCEKMQNMGIATLIVTDISKDGAMNGCNQMLYAELTQKLSVNIIASGGVSSLEEIRKLAQSGLHGAILGKAYYTGAIQLCDAIEVAG